MMTPYLNTPQNKHTYPHPHPHHPHPHHHHQKPKPKPCNFIDSVTLTLSSGTLWAETELHKGHYGKPCICEGSASQRAAGMNLFTKPITYQATETTEPEQCKKGRCCRFGSARPLLTTRSPNIRHWLFCFESHATKA